MKRPTRLSVPFTRAFPLAIGLTALLAPSLAVAAEGEAAPSTEASHVLVRVGAVGAYRSLYDVSMLGGGAALSLGAESGRFGISLGGRLLSLDVLGGLHAMEASGGVTLECRLVAGLRVGAGIAVTRLEVWRATKDASLVSTGPTALARVSYDFGERIGPFVLVDLETQDQASGATPWGPTLEAGVRF